MEQPLVTPPLLLHTFRETLSIFLSNPLYLRFITCMILSLNITTKQLYTMVFFNIVILHSNSVYYVELEFIFFFFLFFKCALCINHGDFQKPIYNYYHNNHFLWFIIYQVVLVVLLSLNEMVNYRIKKSILNETFNFIKTLFYLILI